MPTDRERQVLAFVAARIHDRGEAPTIREIAAACGFASANGAAAAVGRLVERGLLRRERRRPRGLDVLVDPAALGVALRPPRAAVLVLHCNLLFEQVHLVASARVVAASPDPESAEALCRLLADRAAQVRALDLAAQRLTTRPLDASEHALLARFETAMTALTERLTDWDRFLVHEELVEGERAARLDEGGPLAVLAGSVRLAGRCRDFAVAQLARREDASRPTGGAGSRIDVLRRQQRGAIAAALTPVATSLGRRRPRPAADEEPTVPQPGIFVPSWVGPIEPGANDRRRRAM